jgi:diadenosine tetraphosphate (Ap4A) HIT family hydrolase
MKHFEMNSEKIKDRLIVKNDLAFSFPSFMPIVPGHSLVVPIRPVATIDELTRDELKAVMELKSVLCQALTKAFDAEGFNFAWNQGDQAGQSLPHFHRHVVPRKQGDAGIHEYEPRVFLYRPGSREVTHNAELQAVAKHIRSFLT